MSTNLCQLPMSSSMSSLLTAAITMLSILPLFRRTMSMSSSSCLAVSLPWGVRLIPACVQWHRAENYVNASGKLAFREPPGTLK